MGTPFKCWILLCLTATLAFANYTDYSHLKLPPSGSWYLEEFGKLRPGKADKYTGCMCPSTLNTTGSTYMFCGHEMFPKVGGTCQPEGGYRCVNGQAEAIMELDCADESSDTSNFTLNLHLTQWVRFQGQQANFPKQARIARFLGVNISDVGGPTLFDSVRILSL
ncbi:hypothetical protein Fcan01_16998 [Folsomia candida]|uniref:Uncharacterized protein n=1 Tax=Folsomia candida TaxID=158441 RepID=A0A226DTL1_FOLCA|nr:hypothetical protein Fcan01_16998 [Folsomia candida]